MQERPVRISPSKPVPSKKRRKASVHRPLAGSLGRFASALACCAAIAAGTARSDAGTFYWDSDANAGTGVTDGTGTWAGQGSITFFTKPSGPEVAVTAADIVVFGDGGVGGVVTIGGPVAVNTLEFGITNGLGYTLSSTAAQTLTIGSGGILMDAGAQAVTVGNATLTIALGAAQTFRNSSANLLTVAGPITDAGNFLLTLNAAFTGGITLTGAITGAPTSGLLVNSAGSGGVTLSGANTYTGATTIQNGLLIAGTNAPAAGNGAFGNSAGGAIVLGNATTIASALSPTLLTGGAFTVARLINVGFDTTATTGIYTIGGNTASGSTFSGILTLNQSLNVTQVAGGTVNLTGNITSNGVPRTLRFNNVGSVVQNTGVIGSAGAQISIIQAGTGTTTLQGTNTYTGGTTVSAGTLSIGITQNLGLASSNLVLDGGTLQITGGAISGFVVFGHSVVFNATKTVSLDINNAGFTFGADTSLNQTTGGLTKLGAGTLVLSQSNSYTGITTISAGTLGVTNSANLGVGGPLVFDGGTLQILGTTLTSISGLGHAVTFNPAKTVGFDIADPTHVFTVNQTLNQTTGGLTKLGLGTLLLNSAHTYTGTTTVSLGTLLYGANDVIATGPVTVAGGVLDIATFSDTVGVVTLASGSILGTTGTLTGSSYVLQNGTVTAILAGAGAVSKTTGSTVSLQGANTYTGGTTISAGTLSITTPGNLGLPSSNLVFDGGTLQIAPASTITNFSGIGHVVTFNSGKTVGVDISNGSLVFTADQVLNQGTGGFTKLGPGTVVLNQANTYTGPTSVSQGTLRAGVASVANLSGALGNNSAVVMANGVATLDLNNFNTQIGSLTGGGTGAANLGNIILGSATLTVGGNNTSPASFVGIITGSGGLVKIGTGTLGIGGAGGTNLFLSGLNSYTGPTSVLGGTLVLDHGPSDTGKLSPTAVLTLGNATLQLDRAVNSIANGAGEFVLSTTLTGAAIITRPDPDSEVVLHMGAITRNAGGSVNFVIITPTNNANYFTATTTTANANGILGFWATINGTDFAVKDALGNLEGPIIALASASYTDVTRRSSGLKVIADAPTNNVRIIEGTGTVGNITLGAATTTINTLNQTAAGGPATIDMAGKTLATNALLMSAGSGSLAIGTTVGNGVLQAASPGGDLTLQSFSGNKLTINSVIANNTSASSFTLSGTGIVVLAANNTYSGATVVAGGELDLNGSLTAATAINVTGTGSFSQGSASVISGATSSYTQSSSGLSRLLGVNTFTGKTMINGGTLVIGAETGLGANPVSFTADQLTLNGGTLLTTANFSLDDTNRGITLGSAGGTFGTTIGGTLTIASTNVITGSGGLTLTGAGALVLAGANTYTGTTVINGGSLIISTAGALGTATSKIIVNGSAARYGGGGSLVLAGDFLSGVTLGRDIDIMGLGPIADRGAALISVRNNTLSGIISRSSANNFNTQVYSAGGLLQFTGTLNLTGTALSQFITLGGVNAVGVGNFALTGPSSAITGTGSLQKTSAGTFTLDPTTSSGFSGTIRVSGGGTLRVVRDGVFGTRTGPLAANIGVNSVLDMFGGTLEIRMDTPGVNAGGSPALIYGRASSTFFIDHALAGSAINGTATFGTLTMQGGQTYTLNGRNGYGVTFADTPINGGNNATFNNNTLNGLLTLNGGVWNNSDVNARTLTFQGNGDTLVTGYITAAGSDHFLTKTGNGTLRLTASNTGADTNSTFRGATSINGGTLAVTNITSLLNQAATTTVGSNNAINVSTGTTVGVLGYLGGFGTGAGETTPAVINLAGTTASSIILANQVGVAASPLVLSSAVAASGVGAKNLILGGSAATGIINQIQGVIQDNAAANKTSIVKVGGSTWLYAPSAATFGAGTVTTTGGTLGAAQTNTISVNNPAGITVGEVVKAGGTNIPVGAVVTNVLGNIITLNSNIGTAIAANTSVTFGAATNFTGNVTVLGGTLQVKPTAASGNGAVLFASAAPGTQVLTFGADTATFGNQWAGGTFQLVTPSITMSANLIQFLGALTPAAGSSKVQVDSGNNTFTNTLNFASLGTISAGATVNLSRSASLAAITFNTAPAVTNGIIGNARVYFNGADFATFSGGAAAAALYTSQAATLATIAQPTLITGNITSGAVTVRAGIKFGSVQTLTMTGLLTLNNNANTSGGLLVSGGFAATIAGAGGITTAGTGDLVIRTDAPGDTLNLNTPITNTTTGGFTKGGLGILNLGAINLETGTVTINEGTVRLSGTGTLGATNVGLVIRQGGTLDLNGVSVGTDVSGVNSVNAFNGAGIVTNSSATAAFLRIGSGSTAGLFSGTIQDGIGKVSVVKAGSQITTLTGSNTYTGATHIVGGTLAVTSLADIGAASGIGAGTVATNAASLVFNGGLLQYTGANVTFSQLTQTPSAFTNRLFTLAGNATIDSSGQYGNPVLGGGATNSAALIFSNPGSIVYSGAGVRTLTLQGNSTGDNTMGLALVDNAGAALSLTKTGGGLWVLGNAGNVYTGVTTIGGGTLRAVNGSSLPTLSSLVLNGGGILESTGTFSRSILGVAGNLNWVNGGFAAAFSAASPKLAVNFTGGTPTWNSTPNFVINSMILSSATALAEVDIQSAFAIAPGSTTPINVNTTAGNPTVTLAGGTTAGLAVGQTFTGGGTNIPATSTIASIVSATQFTLNVAATTTAAISNLTPVAGGYREIIVNDNPNTATDFATISGSISGSGNLRKSGGGVLQLLGANTYTGQTQVTAGILVVNTLGFGTLAPSSLGISSDTLPNALMLGNGSTGAGVLQYVGTGETSDRMVSLFTTTGSDQIHADGSGPLILTNVLNNTTAGAKTLFLRGSNAQANQITSNLSNNAGTTLGVTVDGGATWVLGGQSTYTGATTINVGVLGAGSSSTSLTTGPFGGGTLALAGGIFFAYGADRSIANSITGGTFTFIGDYSLAFTGTYTAGGGMNTTNNIGQNGLLTDKFLSLGSVNFTGTGNWLINGTGNTVVTGTIKNNTGTTLNLFFNPTNTTNTLTLSGASTYTGATVLQKGTTILAGGSDNHLPSTTALTLGNAFGNTVAVLQLGDANGPSNLTVTSPFTATSNGPVVTIAGSGQNNAIVGGSTTTSAFAVFVNAVDPGTGNVLPAADLATVTPGALLLGSSSVNGPVGNEANLRLVKVGPGTLQINGTRYYTGGTDVGTLGGIDGGTLKITSANYLGNNSTASVLNVYSGTADTGGTTQFVSNLNLGGGAAGTFANVKIGTGTLTVKGDITYNPANNPNTATISGAGSLDFKPSAPFTPNNFTTITVGSSAAGSGIGAADLTISSAIASGTNDIHKEGAGTLKFIPNPGTQWNGSVVLNAGTLILDGTAAANTAFPIYSLLTTSSSFTVNSGTKLNLGATEGDVVSIGQLTVHSTFANPSRLLFNLGAINPANVFANPGNATSDVIDLSTGVLYLDGPTNLGQKVDINKISASFGLGTYTLLEASSVRDAATNLTIVPAFDTFALGTTPGGFGYTLNLVQNVGVWDLNLVVSPTASVYFWKGDLNSKWSSVGVATSNWVDLQVGGAPINGVPGITNNVTFTATGRTNPNQITTTVDKDIGVNLLTINDPTVATINGANATILTIGGGLVINAGTVTIGGPANATPSLDQRLFVGVLNSQAWKNDGGGTLTIANQIFSAASAGTQTLSFNGTQDTIINGNIIDGGLGGKLKLVQSFGSKLTLNNPANAYSGGTEIAAGTIAFAAGALPIGGTVTFTGNGTLQWLGTPNASDLSDRLKIAGGTIGTLDIVDSGNTVTFSNQVQAGPANLTNGTLNKAGAGTLIMAAPYVSGGYQGGTTITQGTLEFGAGAFFPSANITFTGNSTLRWSTGNTDDVSDRLRIAPGVNGTLDTNGNIVTFSANTILDGGNSTGSLTKAGLGTLRLTTTLKSDATPGVAGYSGGTNIFDGTLEFVSGALPATGPVTFNNSAVSSTATLRWITNSANPTNGYDVSGSLKINNLAAAILDTNGNDVSFASQINNGAASLSTGSLTKVGAGTLTMNGVISGFGGYSGGTNIAAGTLEFAAGALPATGAVTFTGSTTLRWGTVANPNNTNDLSNRLTIPAGITGTVDIVGNSVPFASPMPISPGDLVKTGTGTLTFSAPATATANANFTGGLIIDAGTVVVVAGGLSGTSGQNNGTKSVTVAQGATFALQGTTLTDRVNNNAAVTMGTGNSGAPAILQINQFNETMGVFSLAGNSVIDFGTVHNNAQLKFANSAAAGWTGSLSIFNWTGNPAGSGPDQLYFGLDSGGLTASQLAEISFYSDSGATFLGNATFVAAGEVVPVPEPAGLVALFSGTGCLLALRRRRPAR